MILVSAMHSVPAPGSCRFPSLFLPQCGFQALQYRSFVASLSDNKSADMPAAMPVPASMGTGMVWGNLNSLALWRAVYQDAFRLSSLLHDPLIDILLMY